MHKLHLTEDEVEQYAMGKLPENKIPRAEEHLLICQQCRDEVELIVLIIAGVREDIVH